MLTVVILGLWAYEELKILLCPVCLRELFQTEHFQYEPVLFHMKGRLHLELFTSGLGVVLPSFWCCDDHLDPKTHLGKKGFIWRKVPTTVPC